MQIREFNPFFTGCIGNVLVGRASQKRPGHFHDSVVLGGQFLGLHLDLLLGNITLAVLHLYGVRRVGVTIPPLIVFFFLIICECKSYAYLLLPLLLCGAMICCLPFVLILTRTLNVIESNAAAPDSVIKSMYLCLRDKS